MREEFDTCKGGCTCGQFRYRAIATPLIVHACHCRWCQRQTGTSHALNALYEAEMIEVATGEVENITVPSPGGKGQVIARCPNCRIAVWSNYYFGGMRERVRFLRVGTLDNPDLMPPDVHIYTSTKMPWFVIPEGDYAVEEYYDPSTTWSKESQERYRVWKEATD